MTDFTSASYTNTGRALQGRFSRPSELFSSTRKKSWKVDTCAVGLPLQLTFLPFRELKSRDCITSYLAASHWVTLLKLLDRTGPKSLVSRRTIFAGSGNVPYSVRVITLVPIRVIGVFPNRP